MADSKISGTGFTTILWNNANIAASYLAGYFGTGNIRITLAEIAKYVLNNRSLGGTGDLVGVSGAQQLFDKTLTLPCINNSVQITATGGEINYSVGLTSGIQGQINAATGRITNLETATNGLDDVAASVNSLAYTYLYNGFAADGGGLKTIRSENMLAQILKNTSLWWVNVPISITVYSKSMLNNFYTKDDSVGVRYVTKDVSGTTVLDTITLFNLATTNTTYNVCIVFGITDNP